MLAGLIAQGGPGGGGAGGMSMNQSKPLGSETGEMNGDGCDPTWAQPKTKLKDDKLARKDL